ncbi:glycine-rich domain-containing protein [Glycomyces xiaoerkulensis]|uniref:glycine-rich domain-containing protein n=1 Tax=Glycomyces xiaoerkulensis TaxID=2038139 RepID=UPI000C26B269|nr:hypothetical protein [Glycomyces xiaoerkulensis]
MHSTRTRHGRDLIAPATFDRLTGRLIAHHDLDSDTAERVVDQAAAFIAACAATSAPLSPSAAVDLGWHAFILHTRDYAAFCETVAGGFIHHVPHVESANTEEAAVQTALEQTMAAIRAAGMWVDEELWRVDGGVKCSQCHNGCADDPPPDRA